MLNVDGYHIFFVYLFFLATKFFFEKAYQHKRLILQSKNKENQTNENKEDYNKGPSKRTKHAQIKRGTNPLPTPFLAKESAVTLALHNT